MACCKSGSAFVKFKPYSEGSFSYRLNSFSSWKTIFAGEPLVYDCEEILYYEEGNRILFFFKTTTDGVNFNKPDYLGYFQGWITPGSVAVTGPTFVYDGRYIEVTGFGSTGEESSASFYCRYCDIIPLGWGRDPRDGNSFKYNFTVKGQNTGAEYLTLTNLDQCPEVQEEGCQLQPEQKFEIELIQFDASYLRSIPGFSSLPIPTVLTECVIVESAVPLAGPECVVIKKRLGVPYNIFEAIQGVIGLPFESVVRVLCSDPGCPPPQVTVVCGEDDKSDECPPETDCEIVCKGFKCCYSKGKVIKVIPVS